MNSSKHSHAVDSALLERFRTTRALTRNLCEPLQIEDYGLQSMDDASPPKWHLAHTTWFYEQFVLHGRPGFKPFDPAYSYLFNSYYQQVGSMHPRPQRGLLSRPTLPEVVAYREHVNRQIEDGFQRGDFDRATQRTIEIGTYHEQQHQELLLTDIKHGFAQNPILPAYRTKRPQSESAPAPAQTWVEHAGGVADIGYRQDGFHFDNEGPAHRVFAEPFALASRLVTVGEYQEFIADGGYERSELWLSDGWSQLRSEADRRPLYWLKDGQHYTLDGVQPLDPSAPVTHVSYYEAEAYAHWTGFRLPTEWDWEIMAGQVPAAGYFVESGELHPRTAPAQPGLQQLFGDVWEWTKSAYAAYPAYRARAGAIGEYNGKFMCNQMVLRGGSCATPANHVRATYRNFFPPSARWQFSGIRLARDL